MIDTDVFRSESGVDLERKCTTEWSGRADAYFLKYFVENSSGLDDHHIVCGLVLLQDFDSTEVRGVALRFVDHPDSYPRFTSRNLFERHLARGWIASLPVWKPEDFFPPGVR